jgi:hypothetical protein
MGMELPPAFEHSMTQAGKSTAGRKLGVDRADETGAIKNLSRRCLFFRRMTVGELR